jgi:hypothetical protein
VAEIGGKFATFLVRQVPLLGKMLGHIMNLFLGERPLPRQNFHEIVQLSEIGETQLRPC